MVSVVKQAVLLEHLTTIENEIEDLCATIKGQNIFISSLADERLLLKQPIPVHVMEDNGGYIAHYYDVEAVGFGDTVSEALNNLKENITELYFDLISDVDSLGPLPRKWFIILKELIQENG